MHNQRHIGFLISQFGFYKHFDEAEAKDFIKLSKEEKEIIPLDIEYFIKKEFPHLLEEEIVEDKPKFCIRSCDVGLIEGLFLRNRSISEGEAIAYLELTNSFEINGLSNVNKFIAKNYPHLLEENTSNTIIGQPFSIEYIESNFNTYGEVTENEATIYLKNLEKYNQKGNEKILFFIKCNFPRI